MFKEKKLKKKAVVQEHLVALKEIVSLKAKLAEVEAERDNLAKTVEEYNTRDEQKAASVKPVRTRKPRTNSGISTEKIN